MQIAYDYDPVPTIRRFALSDARIRGLMGPFGCLSAETEYLSPSGWKRMDAYVGGQVAQWSPQDGRIAFVAPSAYHAGPAEDLIEFDCGSLVMRLSPEHRVPHLDWAGRFTVKTAGEIEVRRSRRTIPTTFEGPTEDALGMSDDLIRFAVMMHADGHYPKQGKKAQVALRKERKKVRLRALLRRLGVKFTETVYAGRPTEAQFRFVPPYVGKHYTGSWWSASQRELAIVLDEMRYWDGHINEGLIFSSSTAEDAAFIQYAAHANGLRASFTVVNRSAGPMGAWKPHYRVQIRMADNAKNRACIREATVIQRIPAPGGRQYCFTVPSGFFIARCEGTIFITGNSGKSSGCIAEAVRRGQQMPRSPDGIRHSRYAIVRNTYPELRDTTLKSVFRWLPPIHFGHYAEQRHSYQIKQFPGVDLELLFLALDRPEDIQKLLSLEISGAWVNEAREVPWGIIEALDGRIGRFPPVQDVGPKAWFGMWMDTNPPDSDSRWYRFFEDKGWLQDFLKLQREGNFPADMEPHEYAELFKQPSGLTPEAENLVNLQPGYYPKLAVGKAKEWVTVYCKGDYGFVVEGKLVYPEYSDQIHCTKAAEPIEGCTVIRSWDFGLTPACIFSQLQPNGQWVTFDEMTSENMSIDQFSDEVLEHCARAFKGASVRFEDWGDPAGNQRVQTDSRTCFQIMINKNILIEGSIQEPTHRQEAVRKPLRTLVGGEPQFQLHPRCRVLRKGFLGGYHRRRLAVTGERYAADPEKNFHSHCFPASTPVTTPSGEMAIERLRVGDMVSTPLGPRRVAATMNRRADRLGVVRSTSGRSVRCTPEHPFWTVGGFVRADALQYGDVLGVAPWAGRPNTRSKSSTAVATTGSPQAISAATDRAPIISTATSGAFTTARFLLATMCTMWTRTGRTTISATSNCSPVRPTPHCMDASALGEIPKARGSTWPRSDPRHRNGIDRTKVAPGIVSTARPWLHRYLTTLMSAFAAAPTMSFAGVRGSAVIARPLANQLLAEHRGSITRRDSASFAPRPSRLVVIPAPTAADTFAAADWRPADETVFDLTIEDAHCFYAGGFLVSNCHDALQYGMVQYFGPALVGDVPVDDDWPDGASSGVGHHSKSTTGY